MLLIFVVINVKKYCLMKPIQINIKHLRTLKKFSQERFADELKWTRSMVGSYEEGRSEPPID